MSVDSTNPNLDIEGNRKVTNYTPKERRARIAWMFGHIVFRAIPRPFYRARSAWLRLFGARIGPNCQIYPTVRIFLPMHLEVGAWSAIGDGVKLYNVTRISIGERVTVSQGAHLCAASHNFRDPLMPIIRLPITVGDEAWLCAECFISPGISIGARGLVGARALVIRDVPDNAIIGGNPARQIGER